MRADRSFTFHVPSTHGQHTAPAQSGPIVGAASLRLARPAVTMLAIRQTNHSMCPYFDARRAKIPPRPSSSPAVSWTRTTAPRTGSRSRMKAQPSTRSTTPPTASRLLGHAYWVTPVVDQRRFDTRFPPTRPPRPGWTGDNLRWRRSRRSKSPKRWVVHGESH